MRILPLVIGAPLAVLGIVSIYSGVTEHPVPHHDMAGPEGSAFITIPFGIILLLIAIPLLLVGFLKKPKA